MYNRQCEVQQTKRVCVFLVIAGGITAFVDGPQFHHGAMIGVGAAMLVACGWKRAYLTKKDMRK